MRRRFSTAFRPQTDGQTERHNQTLETFLRCYVNYQQDDWVRLLPAAEYAYNSSRNATTGKIPFEMVYNYIPTMQLNPPSERDAGVTNVPNARYTVEEHARAVEEHKKQ
jgi:hypothetical protein